MDKAPEIDADDEVQIWLFGHWILARNEREVERRNGPRAFNVGATIAGHRMGWLAQLIRERRLKWRNRKG